MALEHSTIYSGLSYEGGAFIGTYYLVTLKRHLFFYSPTGNSLVPLYLIRRATIAS